MAEARCLNGDCDREGTWNLQKRLEDYAGSGPSCPDCGSTRVDVEHNGEQRERGSQAQTPARRGSQGGNAPAQQQGGGNMVADVFAVADSDVPAQRRAEAAQGLLGQAGSIIAEFTRYQEQKREAQQARAEQVELQKSDLPTCEECQYQFTGEDIPLNASRVRCPACGSVYDLIDGSP